MKTSAPFIKSLTFFLALAMVRVSLCSASGILPGSIAVLEGSFKEAETGAVWEQAKRRIYSDPRLLVKEEGETAKILDQWKGEGQILVNAWNTADSAAMRQIGDLLEKAWSAYFTFSFEEALSLIRQAEEMIFIPGDSRFRTRAFFESRVLKGMILRAKGDPSFPDEFMRAAALDPEADLAPDRYSPRVIEAYNRAKNSLKAKGIATLSVTGAPADAEVFLNGKKIGKARGAAGELQPGMHFIEAKAPGYEPWNTRIEVAQWEHPAVEFDLEQAGPVGEPASFFLKRLEEGDRSYLSNLAGRLDVDYTLIPDRQGEVLKCWLIDSQGVPIKQEILWKQAEDQGVAQKRMSEFTSPLRFNWVDAEGFPFSQINLPLDPVSSLEMKGETRDVSVWRKYGLVIAVLLVVGIAAASGGDGGGGTSVEVAW